MSENNDTSNDSNGASSILQASRLGGANPLLRSGVLRPSVLGTSVLGSALSNNSSLASKEKDAVVKNPFLREDIDEEADSKETGDEKLVSDNPVEEKTNDNEDDEVDERPDPLKMLHKNGIERVNMFAAAKTSMPRVESSGFVFGQNVYERVVGENINTDNNSNADVSNGAGNSTGELLFSSVIPKVAAQTSMPRAESSGFVFGQNVHERVVGENINTDNSNADVSNGAGNSTGELLFSSVITKVAAQSADNKETESKTLTEVAREYEESRAQKRKYEEVETFTGEEDEVNIVDLSCKLFAFVNSNWVERGRGSMRLNDSKKERGCSRVVFRTAGNLRLQLNTKVWAGMVAERPSQNSLRLTAMDNTGRIKVFLAMARHTEIGQLHKALVERIDKRRATHPEEECAIDNKSESEAKDNATSENAVTAESDAVVAIVDETVENNINEVNDTESKLDQPSSPKKSLLKETAVAIDEAAAIEKSNN